MRQASQQLAKGGKYGAATLPLLEQYLQDQHRHVELINIHLTLSHSLEANQTLPMASPPHARW